MKKRLVSAFSARGEQWSATLEAAFCTVDILAKDHPLPDGMAEALPERHLGRIQLHSTARFVPSLGQLRKPYQRHGQHRSRVALGWCSVTPDWLDSGRLAQLRAWNNALKVFSSANPSHHLHPTRTPRSAIAQRLSRARRPTHHVLQSALQAVRRARLWGAQSSAVTGAIMAASGPSGLSLDGDGNSWANSSEADNSTKRDHVILIPRTIFIEDFP